MDAVAVRAVLARAPGLESRHVRELVAAAGDDLTRSLEPDVLAGAQVPAAAKSFLSCPDQAALHADVRWIETNGARLLASTDPGYPQQLLGWPHAPAILFVLGNCDIPGHPQLAMVGSRKATPAGRRTALDFSGQLARAGLAITSGLAVGIDAASHEGALAAGGPTLAVCATGLDRVYPTQHKALAARIRERGALVSQFPPRTPLLRSGFPRRNALIAALSLGTLVVEAARHSGSLLTARQARLQRRRVFAVPGSIYNPLAEGCHALIRAGASLVESPAQVLSELGFPLLNEALVQRERRRAAPAALDKEYEMLLDAVGFEPAGVDALAARTGLAGESIVSMLLILELEGRIAPYPGGRYGRIP